MKKTVMKTLLLAFLLMLLMQIAPRPANAQNEKPFLHPLFTDNMVLQRGVPLPVWGWTTPGAKVTVKVADKTATATADTTGKWFTRLAAFPMKGPYGPYTLTVSGPQTVTLANVAVGDVWICSGQSNMEFGIGMTNNAPAEIAAANYPNIRLFSVPKIPTFTPLEITRGKWDVCTPSTIAVGNWNGFSAVAYFFGRELNKTLNVPIGLIHSSWGGTIAEAWVSSDSLRAKMPDFVGAVNQVGAMSTEKVIVPTAKRIDDWYAKNDAGTPGNWQAEGFDASAWKTMNLPVYWEAAGLPDYDGVVWFRREVTVPESAAGKEATLHLGPIDDNDTTYLNGVQVGATAGYNLDRAYKIPANTLKAGRNVIAVRVLDTGGGGGIYGTPAQMTLEITGETPIALAGDWNYHPTADIKAIPSYPVPVQKNNPNTVTVLYNGMIAPLVPFGVKGAIWYQGESNVGRDAQYRRLLPTLINDWRSHFNAGPFSFYIVQLANYLKEDTEPQNSAWARLREAQFLTAKNVPHTGIASAIDIGDANDIHPKNKQEVGRRLALNALALTYGMKIEYSGPVYKSLKVENGAIHLSFDHLGGGLVAKGGDTLKGFAIAGTDGKFVWADAKIMGDTVVVSSAQVPNPTMVHYAWSDNPVCNLYNKADLPAVSFRTESPDEMKKTAGK